MSEHLPDVRLEPCPECEFPVVAIPSGSVNGGHRSFGCARCLLGQRDALRKELSDLHAGDTLPRWASEDMPTMEEAKEHAAQLRSRA